MSLRAIGIALFMGSLCVPICYGLIAVPRLLHMLLSPPSWVWPVIVSPITEELCKAFALLTLWVLATKAMTHGSEQVWLWLGLCLGIGFGLTEAVLHVYLYEWTDVDLLIRGSVVVFVHGLPVSWVGFFTAVYGGRGWALALVFAIVWHAVWNASLVAGLIPSKHLTLLFALFGTGVFILPLCAPGSIFRPNRDVRKCDEQ